MTVQPTNETRSAQALRQLLSPQSSSDPSTEFDLDAYEAEQKARRAPSLMEEGNFPKRAVENLGKMHGPGLEAAQALQPRLADGAIVFLIGDRGPGKTQIATWLAWQRAVAGRMSCYCKALDLWGEIRGTWRKSSTHSEDEVVRRYCKKNLLVIDEVQERGDTEADRQWCDRMLTHIVDHRYDGMKGTLLIANLDAASYEKSIPASIRSRVTECGGVKLCDWPSYRV